MRSRQPSAVAVMIMVDITIFKIHDEHLQAYQIVIGVKEEVVGVVVGIEDLTICKLQGPAIVISKTKISLINDSERMRSKGDWGGGGGCWERVERKREGKREDLQACVLRLRRRVRVRRGLERERRNKDGAGLGVIGRDRGCC